MSDPHQNSLSIEPAANLYHGVLHDIQWYEIRRRVCVAVEAGVRRRERLRMLGPEDLQHHLPCLVSGSLLLEYYNPFPVHYTIDHVPDISIQG